MKAGSKLRGALVLALGLWSGMAMGGTDSESAQESVLQGVRSVLQVVEEYSGSDKSGDRQAYLDEVSEVLDPMIGYTVIVSRIMGDTLEEATREQKIRFLKTFKRSMIRTYAGGLYNFGTFEVSLRPDQGKEGTVRNTRVHLEVVSPDGQSYPMVQSVFYSKADERWKIQNVIFNGINLGLTFKKQFEELYRKNDGDLTATIKEWESKTEEAFDSSQFE